MSLRSPSLLTAAAVLIAVFVVMYGFFPYCFGYGSIPVSVAVMCYALWNDYGSWGHGMLVFPIFCVLLYLKRETLSKVPVKGSNTGLAWLLFSVVVYWVGFKTDIQYIGFISAQLFIGSVVVLLLGWRFFKEMLFPWMFITFAWPFLFLDNMIAFPLRVKMSGLCYHFLNLIGMPTLQSGTALLSAPDFANNIAAGVRYTVDIADPCSGIRSLFALTMISALYGYLTLGKSWQKWALFASAIPLAIAGNFVRIIILTFGTLWFGSAFAIGTIDKPTWYHTGAGYFVYIIALGGMVGVGWVISRHWTRLHKAASEAVSAVSAPATGSSEKFDY